VFGQGPDVIAKIAADNPAEMLASYNVKPGELEMFGRLRAVRRFNFRRPNGELSRPFARGRGLTVQQ